MLPGRGQDRLPCAHQKPGSLSESRGGPRHCGSLQGEDKGPGHPQVISVLFHEPPPHPHPLRYSQENRTSEGWGRYWPREFCPNRAPPGPLHPFTCSPRYLRARPRSFGAPNWGAPSCHQPLPRPNQHAGTHDFVQVPCLELEGWTASSRPAECESTVEER